MVVVGAVEVECVFVGGSMVGAAVLVVLVVVVVAVELG